MQQAKILFGEAIRKELLAAGAVPGSVGLKIERLGQLPSLRELHLGSQRLAPAITAAGGRAVMFKTGHSLIKAKMAETGAELAGEMSGHIFFKDRWFGFDDAIYSTLRLLEILTKTDAPLSSLVSDLPKTWSSPELRTDFAEELKFKAVEKAREKLKAIAPESVDVDGVRAIWPDGWGLVRASNTQPILVLRYEATSESRMHEIERIVEGVLGEVRRELGA
jgi:phosphomannomutase/phosphoglucomutase